MDGWMEWNLTTLNESKRLFFKMYCSEGMQECTVFFIDYTSAEKSEIA
jgi:hypothetical protein